MARKGEKAVVVRRYSELLLKAAEELVDQEFGPDGIPSQVRFSEVEQISVELGDALARRIMMRAAARQADVETSKGQVCPECQRDLEPLEPEPRILRTRAGEVEWSEPQCYCRRCRRSFFPSKP